MIIIKRFKCIDFFFVVIISFIRGRPGNGPEINADANTGTCHCQHATDGSNVDNNEKDVLTTIHITQKQIGKICLCHNKYCIYNICIIICN